MHSHLCLIFLDLVWSQVSASPLLLLAQDGDVVNGVSFPCLCRWSSVFGLFSVLGWICLSFVSSCVGAFCIIELNLWHFVSVVCCGKMTSCFSIMGEEIISYSHDTDPAVIFVELCVGNGLLKIYSEMWILIPEFLDSNVYFVKDWSLYIFLFLIL